MFKVGEVVILNDNVLFYHHNVLKPNVKARVYSISGPNNITVVINGNLYGIRPADVNKIKRHTSHFPKWW